MALIAVLTFLFANNVCGQTIHTVTAGDTGATPAFFPSTKTITVGDAVNWSADPALALQFHSSNSGSCPNSTFPFCIAGPTGPGASNQAQFSISTLGGGNHTITADYSGDGNFNAVNGTAMSGNPQVVNKSTPTVSLTSSLNAAFATQTVTFTATVSGSGTTPTGTITLLDGATSLLPAVTLSSGSANKSTTTLAGGNHTISASYSGDSNYNAVTGNLNTNPQVIRDFTVSVTPTTLNGITGQVRTYNGTITSLGGFTHTVNLSCGSGAPFTCTPSVASVAPPSNGTASFTLTVADPGPAGASFSFNVVGSDTAAPFSIGSPLLRQQGVTYNVVNNSVDLQVSLNHGATPDPVQLGKLLQLDAVIKNGTVSCPPAVTCPASNIVLEVSFSAPVFAITATPALNCTQGIAPITCNFTSLAQGATQNVTLTFAAPFARLLTATAVVSSGDSEQNASDNSISDPASIRLLPFTRRGLPLILP